MVILCHFVVSVAFGGGHKFRRFEPGGERFGGDGLGRSAGAPGAHTSQAGQQHKPE